MESINGIYGLRQRDSIADARAAAEPGEMVYALDDRAIVHRSLTGGKFLTLGAKILSVLDFEAVGDGVTDDSGPFQDAIDEAEATGGAVYVPAGTYVAYGLTVPTSVSIFGQGKYISVITVPTLASGTDVTIFTCTNSSKVQFRGLGFDGGSGNYPDDTTTLAKIVAGINATLAFPTITAIKFELTSSLGTDVNGVDTSVCDCHFENITNYSIRYKRPTGTDSYRNIEINGCTFYKGAYQERVVSITGLLNSGNSFARGVRFINNFSRRNGPAKYMRLGFSGFNGSTDCFEFNSCQDVVCSGSVAELTAGIGFRVEASEEVDVTGCASKDTGQEGFSFYNSCKDCSITGSSARDWGKIPNFGGLREYSGTIYIARENPGPYNSGSPTVTFPADPSTSLWFEASPYNLQGVSQTTIPDYHTSNYYKSDTAYSGDPTANPPTGFSSANAQGVAPFRGYAGISVTQLSERITISGNTIVGNLTQTGGKYDYASDYGISTVHSSNEPQAYKSPIILGPNTIRNCRVAEVYQPGYVDPINRQGLISGVRHFPLQMGIKKTSAAVADEPIEMFPSLQENLIHAATVPHIAVGTTGYARMAGANRPVIGTGVFGLRLDLRFTASPDSTARYLFDAGVGGAATAGWRVWVKVGEINFSLSDGTTNYEIRYTTVTDWGSGDNKNLRLYCGRDSGGVLRMIVNGTEKIGAHTGPEKTAIAAVDVDTGNDYGLNLKSNGGSSEALGFRLFRCTLYGQSLSFSDYMNRLYEKPENRVGDTILMDLDFRARGLEIMDKVDLTRLYLMSSSGVSVSEPLPQLRRVLSITTNAVGNVGAGEDDLMSFSVVANTLYVDREALEIEAGGTLAANGNNKRIRAYFGSDTLFDTTALALNTGDWNLRIRIIRTGATTQKAIAVWTCGNSAFSSSVDYTTPGRTLSSANTFKLTAEATSNDDVKQEFMRIEKAPAA